MNRCKYILAWCGQCKNEKNIDFCDEHLKHKCATCGKQSIKECEEDLGNFVCGAEICEDNCHNHYKNEGEQSEHLSPNKENKNNG